MKRLAIIINVQTPLVLKSSLYTIDLKVLTRSIETIRRISVA